MFCPQCSQAQVNLELKFCSRCGFPLRGVKELMATGGEPIAQADLDGRRIKTARCFVQGLVIIMCSMMIGGGLVAVGREFGFSRLIGELTIVFGVLIGFLRMVTAMMMPLSRPSTNKLNEPASAGAASVSGARGAAMLADAQTMPIGYEPARDIELPVLVPGASVTENTTRSLDSRELPGIS